ncbi:MAG TPA: hypothetical protein HPP81_06765 [Deltaproteobacteria bacterium]|jgi:Na+/H+ antiporter NhaD/arsenite permease-like protein|nr:hypothetical protein [Deltaproteobacteria bacterium]HIJ76403.1 hypothetical protein [Deltaproteobacteria bacterium]
MLTARIARMRADAIAGGFRWLGSFDLKSLLLIGLICFLLVWAFWGKDFENYRMAGHNSLATPLSDMAGAVTSPQTKSIGLGLIVRQIIIISILALTTGCMFYLLYKRIVKRTLIVLCFAGIMVLLGMVFGIYGPVDAFFAIKFDTLALLLGMGMISAVLDEAGFFASIAYKMQAFTGTSVTRVFVLFCLLTYSLSLFVNNLTTVLVVAPVTLRLAAIAGFDPRPIIIGEIIASNLGGASCMIGDFPYMLIAAETGIGFSRFFVFMTPICLVLLGILLLYFQGRIEKIAIVDRSIQQFRETPKPHLTGSQRWAIRRGIFALAHLVFLLAISEVVSINVSAVALFAGISIFMFCRVDRKSVIRKIGFNDLLFFAGLSVIVGALEASGFLEYVSRGIAALSFDRPWLLCLMLMWSAALVAAFLNAGPTTLLFFPVVMGFTIVPPHHIIWWALALGIMAGSSATIFGATAGPVAANLVEKFCVNYRINLVGGNALSYEQFLETGLPIMLIFLGMSSLYIVFLCAFL